MEQRQTTTEQNAIQLAVMANKMENIEKTTNRIENTLHEFTLNSENTYATKAELAPVKSVVYGLVSIILTAVVGAMVYLVVNH